MIYKTYFCQFYVLLQWNKSAQSHVYKSLLFSNVLDDIGFGPWGEWSVSLVNCGPTEIKRMRKCVTESGCSGPVIQIKTLFLDPCPGIFTDWSACSHNGKA